MEKKIVKKLRVYRFIPSIVVQLPSGFIFAETSSCVYEDKYDANEALERIIKIYRRRGKVLRSSVVLKYIDI